MPLLHLEPVSRRVTQSDLLAFLHRVDGLDHQRVGRIGLGGGEATIESPEGGQPPLVKALGGETLGGRRVQVWAEVPSDSGAGGEGHCERLARLERTVGTL